MIMHNYMISSSNIYEITLKGEVTLKGIPKPLSFSTPRHGDKARHDPQPSGHEMANHKENRSNNVLEPMCVQT